MTEETNDEVWIDVHCTVNPVSIPTILGRSEGSVIWWECVLNVMDETIVESNGKREITIHQELRGGKEVPSWVFWQLLGSPNENVHLQVLAGENGALERVPGDPAVYKVVDKSSKNSSKVHPTHVRLVL
jgi:hypothetical protein